MNERQKKVLELLDSHGESLHRLLGRLTRCEHTTGDLMQELFIRLSGSPGFARADNQYAYAWKTATNLAFQWRRRQRSFTQLEYAEMADESRPTAVDGMIRDEHLDLVLKATSQLKELARNVIVMRFIEQRSYETIAERLGKNPDYMRSLCAKSLKKLQAIFKKHYTHTDKEVSND